MKRAVFVLVLAAGCSNEAAPPPAAVTTSSATVRWRPARAPGETALLEAPARVMPDANSATLVSAPLRARIVAIRFAVGSEVEAGAPLVEIAMPEVATAAAEYLAALDQLDATQRRTTQLADLRKEGLARAADLSALEIDLAKLRGARDLAATTLRTANLGLGDARGLAASGGRTSLRAPRAGRITKATAVVGAIVSPDTPLVEIAGGGSTRIEAMLAYPLPAESTFSVELGGQVSPAMLVGLSPTREADGTTRAWFDVQAPLPAGQAGRLRVMPPSGTAVAVPAAAIASEGAITYVWRRENGQPRRLPVRVLATSGADALVTGPAVGDAIASVASSVVVVEGIQ